jgi:hypothetical protein
MRVTAWWTQEEAVERADREQWRRRDAEPHPASRPQARAKRKAGRARGRLPVQLPVEPISDVRLVAYLSIP